MIITDVAFPDNLYFHKMTRVDLPVGVDDNFNEMPIHHHPYSHTMEVRQGPVEIWYEETNNWVRYDEPTFITIKKDLRHGVRFLADKSCVCCVHILREENGEIIPFDIVLDADDRLRLTSYLQKE